MPHNERSRQARPIPVKPLASLLLRIVLSLGLILNGSGLALAGMHGQARVGAAAAIALQTPHRAHGEQPAGGAHNAHQVHAFAHPPSAGPAAADPTHAGPDCCETGADRCASGHGVLVAVSTPLPELPLVRMPNLWLPTPGYASPAPSRLIRPPIG